MQLHFLGTGSAFTNNHTSAYFSVNDNRDMVLIDLSMLNIEKALKITEGKEHVYLSNIPRIPQPLKVVG